MAVQRASIERKSAPLHSDFGRDFLNRRFGERDATLILSLLPTYSRGPRRGLAKGYIHWDKVTVGGWRHDANGLGHVERPGTRNVRVCASNDPDSRGSISEHRRCEAETDEQREQFIRDALADIFGRKTQFGTIPARLQSLSAAALPDRDSRDAPDASP